MSTVKGNFRTYLADVASQTEWYLSDWMDEESLSKVMRQLLSMDLLNVWKNLKKAANTDGDFDDLFCMAADSCYRYLQIANKTERDFQDEWLNIAKHGKAFKKALERNQNMGWKIDSVINALLMEQAKRSLSVSWKDGYLTFKSEPPMPPRFHFKAHEIIGAIIQEASQCAKEPSDIRLSKKRGKSGLIAFYTNSLCDLTRDGFKRPCYAEIANIANIVLQTPENKPVTEENVRINYQNFYKRKVANNDRKITI